MEVDRLEEDGLKVIYAEAGQGKSARNPDNITLDGGRTSAGSNPVFNTLHPEKIRRGEDALLFQFNILIDHLAMFRRDNGPFRDCHFALPHLDRRAMPEQLIEAYRITTDIISNHSLDA